VEDNQGPQSSYSSTRYLKHFSTLVKFLQSRLVQVWKRSALSKKKMREMGFGENLVEWTKSFTEERRTVMALDGYRGSELEAITGLAEESAISPVLFAIYITDIHSEAGGKLMVWRIAIYG
jgi:hypothetical protein